MPSLDELRKKQKELEDYSQGADFSAYQNALKQYNERPQFQYDLNGDALYKQYKDQYMAAGKQAMNDTIGKASAMTGGYGNSYAATVGNQAYNAQLEKMNDVVPQLYSLAYSAYQDEGNRQLQKAANLGEIYAQGLEARQNALGNATDLYKLGYAAEQDAKSQELEQYKTLLGLYQNRDTALNSTYKDYDTASSKLGDYVANGYISADEAQGVLSGYADQEIADALAKSKTNSADERWNIIRKYYDPETQSDAFNKIYDQYTDSVVTKTLDTIHDGMAFHETLKSYVRNGVLSAYDAERLQKDYLDKRHFTKNQSYAQMDFEDLSRILNQKDR